MINLNTNLTKETIKKSEKLLKIECRSYWFKSKRKGILDRAMAFSHWAFIDANEKYWKPLDIFAPTLADVISNAESLFFDDFTIAKNVKIKLGAEFFSHKILDMCLNNKSLKEIEEMILSNLK